MAAQGAARHTAWSAVLPLRTGTFQLHKILSLIYNAFFLSWQKTIFVSLLHVSTLQSLKHGLQLRYAN